MSQAPDLSEFSIISRYFAPLAATCVPAFGLTDDAAVLAPQAGWDLVVSTDTIVEGVHFLAGEDAEVIAERLLAVGFSDVAAMGAVATVYTLSIALPRGLTGDALAAWLARFSRGLAAGQARLQATLAGGDTVVTPGPLTLTLTAFGEVERGGALRRSGARPGDRVYVSGTIGDAAFGLAVARGGLDWVAGTHCRHLMDRYRRPTPRMDLGRQLAGVAHAAADVSDGLIADLEHICHASGVGACVHAARVPLSPAAAAVVAADPNGLATALTGGDDYELVFTVPPEAASTVAAAARRLSLPLTEIGEIVDPPAAPSARPVQVVGRDGASLTLPSAGYEHL